MSDDQRNAAGSPVPAVELRTLGRFEITIYGRPLNFERRAPQRTLQLLAVLVSRGRQAICLGTLADLLWPEADAFDAQRALTTTLHRLRRLLGTPQAIRLCGGQIWIDAGLCSVDAWRFERALRTAASPEDLVAALELYRGPFLADDQSPWALAMRARLERQVASARRLLTETAAQPLPWRLALGRAWALAE